MTNQVPNPPTCSVADCTNPLKAHGLCQNHYMQKRRAEGYKPPTRKRPQCSVDGCTKSAQARGLCPMHYSRLRLTGDLGSAEPTRRGERPCKIDGCANRARSSDDLCATHYRRKKLYQSPTGTWHESRPCTVCAAPSSINSPRRADLCPQHFIGWAKAEAVAGRWPSNTTPRGYVQVAILKTNHSLHRLVMEHLLGRPLRANENVHHKNGDRADNRPENLELWVKPQVAGQRVEDLVAFVVDGYPELVRAYLDGGAQT